MVVILLSILSILTVANALAIKTLRQELNIIEKQQRKKFEGPQPVKRAMSGEPERGVGITSAVSPTLVREP